MGSSFEPSPRYTKAPSTAFGQHNGSLSTWNSIAVVPRNSKNTRHYLQHLATFGHIVVILHSTPWLKQSKVNACDGSFAQETHVLRAWQWMSKAWKCANAWSEVQIERLALTVLTALLRCPCQLTFVSRKLPTQMSDVVHVIDVVDVDAVDVTELPVRSLHQFVELWHF